MTKAATLDPILQELSTLLGDAPYLELPILVDLNIFGSKSSVQRAVREGRLKVIKVSKARYIVSRTEVLRFIRESING
ncbi:MAG: helix-turn-helix domain-containing protein [Parachlamydia sp.]|nr:helix-turn-helix domain-containing protein [Parachlamydia sp.]